MNKEIEKLRLNIAQAINDSQLPVGVVYFVLKDIVNETSYFYTQSLKEETPVQVENKAGD